MPYKLQKSGSGYKVRSPHKMMSKHPMSKEQAAAQMRALYANMPPGEKGLPKYRGKAGKRGGVPAYRGKRK